MSEELNKPEQLLMWELFAAGGVKLLKDIVPKPKGAHTALAGRGYLTNVKNGQTRLLELQDRGWRWIADCDPFPIGADETRVTAERRLLQSLARGIKRYAAASGRTLPELFRVEPQVPLAPRTKAPARAPRKKKQVSSTGTAPHEASRDLAQDIRDAFHALAGHPARDSVRLSALRGKLPHVARPDLDAVLLAMRKAGQANLMNLDNPRDIAAEKGSELRSGAQVFHVVWIDA